MAPSIIVTVLGALLLPLEVAANDGMSPTIHQLIQEGQDVRISVRISDAGEPDLTPDYRIVRTDGDAVQTVLSDKTFTAAEAVSSSGPECRWWEPLDIYCYDYPEYCEDCNNDGYDDCFGTCSENPETMEMECVQDYCDHMSCGQDCDGDGEGDCDGWCQTIYTFEVLDECVSPGTWDYELFYLDSYSDDWSSLSWEQTVLEVTDSGEVCTPPEDGTGDSEPQCSVSSPGAAGAGLLDLLLRP